MSVPVTRVLLPAEELEARIGYQFKNKALLKRALTPVSYTHLTLPTNREV